MPYQLDTHVLTVDANVIHKVDTANPATLYSMWTVFSRCADSVEQGRRLENLSWRLWQREQLVNRDTTLDIPTQQPQQVLSEDRLQEIPHLSGSVESLVDEDASDLTSDSTASLGIFRPRIHRLDSTTSSRGRRDRHISSDDFEKMIVSIVQDKEPLSASASSPTISKPKEQLPVLQEPAVLTTTTITTIPTQEPNNTSAAMSFTTTTTTGPAHIQELPVSQAFAQSAEAASNDAIPDPTSSPAAKPVHLKKAPAQFALGGSCSSSEQSHSIDGLRSNPPHMFAKKPVYRMRSSSEDGSLKNSMHSVAEKKQPVTSAPMPRIENNDSAIDSDTEGEYIDESAIDDEDDSSDWEDSIEDSGKSSVDDKFFQRVESKGNLASRPSLITLMLAQNERALALANNGSQSTSAIIPRSRTMPNGSSALAVSPSDSDEGPLMMKGVRHPALKSISEVPRSVAQPIVVPTTHIHHQAAFSPRTTRRHMLATELTESLRRHLLWERQQKTSTANAVLKRRHTSQDVSNLKQFPDKPCLKQEEDANAGSWNQYLNRDELNGYHSKGW